MPRATCAPPLLAHVTTSGEVSAAPRLLVFTTICSWYDIDLLVLYQELHPMHFGCDHDHHSPGSLQTRHQYRRELSLSGLIIACIQRPSVQSTSNCVN